MLSSFGRRKGRRLRVTKAGLMETLFPSLKIELAESSTLPPETLFAGKQSYWLEIGFGGGEHLAHQAGLNPDTGIIGCEPYINGMAELLRHIDTNKLDNIRVYCDDARHLIDQLPDKSIERVFILYPDPWPKMRHKKRRLVSTDTLNRLSRIMKSGALLRLATDHADYATWMLEHLLAHPDFEWTAKEADDWRTPPKDWIPTRYEQKALAGKPTYLEFHRL